MSIEGIKSTGMVYQGSVTPTVHRPDAVAQTDISTENKVSQDGNNIDIKQSADNSKDGAAGNKQNKNNISAESLQKALADMNKQSSSSMVQFGMDDITNRITIKILDKDTKKVIKEFPAEKTLDIIAKVWEVAGILVDEKR